MIGVEGEVVLLYGCNIVLKFKFIVYGVYIICKDDGVKSSFVWVDLKYGVEEN